MRDGVNVRLMEVERERKRVRGKDGEGEDGYGGRDERE